MKLLFCEFCADVVKLQKSRRWCECGKTGGHYLSDGAHASVTAGAVVIGIDNRTMRSALQARESDDAGHRTLAAWLMGKDAPRVRWESQ